MKCGGVCEGMWTVVQIANLIQQKITDTKLTYLTYPNWKLLDFDILKKKIENIRCLGTL
jgi:hypothetical protein